MFPRLIFTLKLFCQTEDAVAKALAKNGTQVNEAPISVVRWRSWRACQVQSLGVAVFGLLHSKSSVGL